MDLFCCTKLDRTMGTNFRTILVVVNLGGFYEKTIVHSLSIGSCLYVKL